jgi:hypothetical protein
MQIKKLLIMQFTSVPCYFLFLKYFIFQVVPNREHGSLWLEVNTLWTVYYFTKSTKINSDIGKLYKNGTAKLNANASGLK